MSGEEGSVSEEWHIVSVAVSRTDIASWGGCSGASEIVERSVSRELDRKSVV